MFDWLKGKARTRPLALHVDDEKDIRELVAVILDRFGLDVASAGDAAEALALARKERPSIILLDIVMPGVDGFELCRSLRREKGLEKVPILMVTALDQLKDVEKALAQGADGYITKPFEPPKIRTKIAEFLPALG